MQRLKFKNGIEGHIVKVLGFLEIKLYEQPSRTLTSMLLDCAERLKKELSVSNVVVTIDAIAFSSDLSNNEILEHLKSYELSEKIVPKKRVKIKVNYNGKDIDTLCEKLFLDKSRLIDLHTSHEYYVSMLGFLPGFPYIGGLPEELRIPRKDQADKQIPAGTIAIANEFTGIYPTESPGGWYAIGNTEYRVYDSLKNHFDLSVGDCVQFQSLGI